MVKFATVLSEAEAFRDFHYSDLGLGGQFRSSGPRVMLTD